MRRELEALRTEWDDKAAGLRETISELELERDQAKASLKQKAEMLAHMSHELRTPMNSILGMTRLTLQSELSQKQREYLEVVQSSADALLTLINDILDLSKLDAGPRSLEQIPFNLADSIGNTVRSIILLAEEKGIGLEVNIGTDVPDVIVGDPGRLRQVLINLVGNAIKFTDAGTVTVGVSKVAGDSEGVVLNFKVTDTGVGIPSDRIDTIFEPYLQAAESTARTHGGTGLGLAICRDIVKLMGGDIVVDSTEGLGSTFRFNVRFDRAERLPSELAAADELAEAEVFVIAGERAAYALAQNLDGSEASVSVFADVRTALEAAAVAGPNAVIVDMDEIGLGEAARFAPDACVLVVTSAGQRGDAARCRDLGIAAYLTRPLGPLDLRDALRGAIGRTDDSLITRHWLRERRPVYKVLLADDSPANRLMVTQMLTVQGHQVEAVANGQEAVNAFKSGAYDIILMDMEMPEMDGVTAARTIREAESVGHIPIVALTGHSSREMIQRCLDAGMDDHLTKPFEFVELADTIERLAARAG